MLPAVSIAVTWNTLLPSELVVIVSPSATVPMQDSTAALSAQAKSATTVLPSL